MAVAPFSLSLSTGLSTAAGTIERRRGFLVRTDREGAVGIGEASPLPGWTESHDACRETLDAWAAGGPDLLADGRGTPAARHGVALANTDRRARAKGRPLYRHLGGPERVESVPVNATIGDGTPSETAASARDAADRGFETLKVKVGARPIGADVERLRAVRAAVGDLALRVDANGAYDPETAERALDAFAAVDPAYVEQPVPGENLAALAALRAHEVPVAADEAFVHHGVEATLAAADVVVCKPMVLGGPGRAREVALRARETGGRAVVTTTIDAVVARTAAVHVAASLPERPACGLATADLLAEDLAADPAPVADGAIAVPDSPGIGVDPAEVWSRD